MRILALIAALAAVAAVVPARAAEGDYEIQSSTNAPAHPVGQKLGKGAKLTLPENSQISFFDRTTGGSPVTRTCTGKYEGPIDKCRAQASGRPTVLPGATRGALR